MQAKHFFGFGFAVVAAYTAGSSSRAGETSPLAAAQPRLDLVPGVVIDHSPASSGIYIGSPSLAVLPDGDYVASHDFFGPGSSNNRTAVFRSRDRGQSWGKLAELEGQIRQDANELSIGPMGFGGRTTVLGVKIGAMHRLPASFFVSIAYMCWANRRASLDAKANGKVEYV